MKKLAVLVASAVAAPLVLIPAASAAVPKRAANATVKCGTGTKSAAIWWDAKHLAAKNPCSQWLVIGLEHETPDRGSERMSVSVAPGAHFNVKLTKLAPVSIESGIRGAFLTDSPECGITFLKNSKGKSVSYC